MTRNESVNGEINVKFIPIYDEEGNQVFINGDENVKETPFAYGDSVLSNYSYIYFQ